ETAKFILPFHINLICFFSFSCAMTQNTLGPQKAFIHHWLCADTRGGRQPYVFFLRDDSYQTENKGSVTMNKKKPLSVSNPSILGRSNYTQLARLRQFEYAFLAFNSRCVLQCNKQLLHCTEYREAHSSAATRGESGINGAQRISAIRHARFPPWARPSSRKESRLVTMLYVFLRVVCLAMEVPFHNRAAIIVKNVDPRRVLYLVSRWVVHMQVYEGRKSRQCALRHPRRVNGAALEDGSFTICPRRSASALMKWNARFTKRWHSKNESEHGENPRNT
ncbi:hypothetical protein ALC56_01822, partial [Trachymyrmex septentrionalis]